jgi:ABC-type branched-subunit amino acid transport system ATPase component
MLLQLEGLSVRFGGVEALAGVDLKLAPGQALGLVGANGCGKTTLFNALTGVVRASTGRVVFLGRDITGAAVHDIARAGIARTFQTVRLFPTMTVADNVERADAARVEERVEQALAQAGLTERRAVLAGELSLVEQRRLEIARALARAPRLLLMDEPTSGLNPGETEDMIALLACTVLPGRAAIVAEHKAHVIAALCSSAVLLDQGRKVKEGPCADLLANLATPEVKPEIA